jgi:hypothetical protein
MNFQPAFSRTFLYLSLFLLQLWFGTVPAEAQIRARVVAAVDAAHTMTLKGNVHPLARAEFDHGAIADGQPMKRILLLLSRGADQQAALSEAMEKQHDKSSPSYHQWFTPEQFGAQFGPADADVRAVTDWLTKAGFTVEKVYGGKTIIEFSGTVGQVRGAFATDIRNYQVSGQSYLANENDPQIPAALAPVITGIVSLNNFPRKFHALRRGGAQRVPGMPGLLPLYTFPSPYSGAPFYGVGPGDFATIYNSKGLIAAGNDGTGQTIAIVGETNINVQDIISFRSAFGLPANFSASNVILNGEDPGITSIDEESEADLDVEWSGAVAPGATVDFVVSASTPASAGIDLSALYIIEHNLAGVMSESYGSCEASLGAAGNAFYRTLWEQAAAQGITVMLSSGDGGSAGCDNFNAEQTARLGLAVSGMASTPFNVSVGGTDFDEVNRWSTFWLDYAQDNPVTGTSALSYIPEIPWNENCAQIGLTGCGVSAPGGSLNIVGGSGGPSNQVAKPTWQMGVSGMPNDSHRDQPDISLFASPGFNGSGYLICQADAGFGPCEQTGGVSIIGLNIIGGTSASAPAFAGVMALVNQYQPTVHGTNRQGNANYVLYGLDKKTGSSCVSTIPVAATCVFYHTANGNRSLPTGGIGVGTNSVPCAGGSPNCSSAAAGMNGVLVDPAHKTVEAWTVGASGSGYDMVTGLGSVNIGNLAAKWGTVSTVATATTLSLSKTTGITHGTAEGVTATISVTPTSGTATGDVALLADFGGGNIQGLDQFTLGANGKFSGTTSSLPGGTSYKVYAHYAGDGTNAPSDSTPVTVTVGQEASQTFIVIATFDANGNPVSGNASTATYGSDYIIRMYVTDKNGVANPVGAPSGTCDEVNLLTCPTGTVSLTNSGAGIGTGGGGSGVYNLNSAAYTRNIAPNLLGGTYALKAAYSGDNSFATSTSASTAFTVTPAAISNLTLYNSTNPRVGAPFTIQVGGNSSGAPLGAAPTGTISVYDGATLIAGPTAVTGTPGINGQLPTVSDQFTLTISSGGDHSLTAKYSGDTNYAATTTSAVIVHPAFITHIAVTQSAATVNLGQSVTITATITTGTNTPPMTGSISFSGSYTGIPSPVAGTLSTDANGNQQLTATVTTSPQFTEYVEIAYAGDSNFAAADTQFLNISVNIPDFTLGPSAGVSVIPVAGQPATGQITITPVSQTPSTVTLSTTAFAFSGYTVALSAQPVSLNGAPVTATITMTPTVTVPSNAVHTQVHHAAFFTMDRNDWWRLSGTTGICALFFLTFSLYRRRYREAFGFCAFCVLFLAFGCGGTGGGTIGGGGGSGGTGGGGGSGPEATTITLTTSNAKVAQNAPFLITATITSSKPLTGTVTFYNFGTAFAGGFPTSNGQAQTGQGYLNNPGVYQVTATYSGDSQNLSSTSAPLVEVITGTFPFTIQGSTGGDVHYLQGTIGVQ